MATIFSDVLTQLRKDSGFATAYSFYHANGGAPVLKVSYRKYLMMEQGKILPVFDRLRRLSFALRLPAKSTQYNCLIIAWLRTMAGEDNYRDVLEPVISPKAEEKAGSPLHSALKKSLAGNKYFMTPAQLAAVASSFDTYICFVAMSAETGVYTVDELGKSLGLKKAAAIKAVKTLAGAKIIKEEKKGACLCPMAAYSSIEAPSLQLIAPELRLKLMQYERQLSASGNTEWSGGCILRADSAVFRGYMPLLQMSVDAATTYGITHKTDKSALYMVEGQITRLRNF
ncbi:MAG: hypothetical protein NTY45_10275 [Elusimicrobia bacterium]|nr:hypothetical protein [Elusimicrobiota bacterium]